MAVEPQVDKWILYTAIRLDRDAKVKLKGSLTQRRSRISIATPVVINDKRLRSRHIMHVNSFRAFKHWDRGFESHSKH
jgi:hypothetical protein